jgi:hypothetical protein
MGFVWETEIATGIAEALIGVEGFLLFVDMVLCDHVVHQLLLPGPSAVEDRLQCVVLCSPHRTHSHHLAQQSVRILMRHKSAKLRNVATSIAITCRSALLYSVPTE